MGSLDESFKVKITVTWSGREQSRTDLIMFHRKKGEVTKKCSRLRRSRYRFTYLT